MKILVPTDGSSCAIRALRYAAKLASIDSNIAVVSLSVHDHQGSHPVCPRGVVSDYLHEVAEVEVKPHRLASNLPAVSPVLSFSTGHVADEIVKIAETGGFDLIVMGLKGRSPIGELLLGSVAQKVLSATRLPVTLVK